MYFSVSSFPQLPQGGEGSGAAGRFDVWKFWKEDAHPGK